MNLSNMHEVAKLCEIGEGASEIQRLVIRAAGTQKRIG